ncbi:MAG TPA: PQQ-dependent sugar dehydrogenase [Planctomycetota bacterium]|nr:PQQ-dependent sugar dehydrogenase [Planctomycetota bacterium]
MRSLPMLLSLMLCLGTSCAQDDEPELPAGPAIVYEKAFPAQAPFDRPLFVAFDATDPEHAYVVVQPGQVFVVPRDGTKADRSVFFDLGKKVFVNDNWEEGLLGFAFDPDYGHNGFCYAYWTERTDVREEAMGDGRKQKSNRQSVLARYATRVQDGRRVADLDSELRVLQVFEPFGNHNGGTIVFGPDHMLYVALGDGGAANDPFDNAQSKHMLLGKVLRIDVRGATADKPYAVPADNPFVAEPGARPEIWCYGMRNPWRISFDRDTGELWCGDVGQNRIEEVDRLVKGGNYGWNFMEASEVFKLRRGAGQMPEGLIAPIAEYDRTGGLSITGGYVYRGKRIAELQGFFVYGDFMACRMWACKEDRRAGKHTIVTLPRAPLQPSSFAEEPDGELLMTGFNGKKGEIFRLVPGKAD